MAARLLLLEALLAAGRLGLAPHCLLHLLLWVRGAAERAGREAAASGGGFARKMVGLVEWPVGRAHVEGLNPERLVRLALPVVVERVVHLVGREGKRVG